MPKKSKPKKKIPYKNPAECPVLLVDVGNTSTSVGLWNGTAVTCISVLPGGINDPEALAHELDMMAANCAQSALVASVVPALNEKWIWMLHRLFGLKAEILSHGARLPISLRGYRHPASIGADRLCDASGAFVRHGGPVAVADFGTALTFDVVDRDGVYRGGLIAPGLPLMSDYLHEKTAQLPAVDLRAASPVWGDGTEHAMQLGAKIAHRGMVREMMSFIRGEIGPETVFCATGGYASWALGDLDGIRIEPDLTLFGLGAIWNANHPVKK